MHEQDHPPASRILHHIDRITSSARATVAVAGLLVGFFAALAVLHLGSTWETSFSSVVAAITLVMAFVIQHTQSRLQTATQLKLDELIRAAPRADDRLVHIEHGSDDELYQLEQRQVDHHAALRDDDQPSRERGITTRSPG